MCELVLSFRDEAEDRRLGVPHESVPKATELLGSMSSGWWPFGSAWPRAILFDLWPGFPPLLVNGEYLKAVTVDPCDDYRRTPSQA